MQKVTDESTVQSVNHTLYAKWRGGSVTVSDLNSAGSTLKLYPNPVVNGVLTVEMPEVSGVSDVYGVSGVFDASGVSGVYGGNRAPSMVRVYDINGKLVLSKPASRPKTTLNISHLPNGSYIVKIGEVSAKLVKQ
jgi:hypothetical protein